MPEAHSQWSASKFASTIASPGLTALDQLLAEGDPRVANLMVPPPSTSEHAAEGTAAHRVVEIALNEGNEAAARMLDTSVTVGEYKIHVDVNMVNHGLACADNIRAIAGEGGSYSAEQELDYSESLGLPEGEAWGTADAVIQPGDGELVVVDYKYGRGISVSPERNPQMMLYAAGALEAYSLFEEFDRVRMIIDQPRNGGIKEWDCTVEELNEWLERVARPVVRSVQTAKQTFKSLDDREWLATFTDPFAEACRWSVWLPLLPNALDHAQEFATAAEAGEFLDLSEDQLAEALAIASGVERWVESVREEAHRRLANNIPVPGFKLVRGRPGSRAWKDPAGIEDILKGMRLRQDVIYTQKLASPTQVEKSMKAGHVGPRQWARLQEQITRPEGKLSVVPEGDPRAAVTVAATAEEFEDLSGEALW